MRIAKPVPGLLLLWLASGCGGSSPTAPAPAPGSSSGAVASTPTPTPTPVAGPATSVWLPPGLEGCAWGFGSIHNQCDPQGPQLLDVIDDAIEGLLAEQPELFDATDTAGPGSPRVLDADGFHQALLTLLRSAGLCADFDGQLLQVKNGNEFSESYGLLLPSGHLSRGEASYRQTCAPAAFPVDPQQIIHRVRVGFYGFNCYDRETPGTNDGWIPVGCLGLVTATPKDIHDNDVPARLHGPDIQWDIYQDGLIADIYESAEAPFNLTLEAFNPGDFRLCALVQEIEGCMEAEVVP